MDLDPSPSARTTVQCHGHTEAEAGRGWPEANLKRDVVCSKNPGHTSFIPAPSFGVEHLPEGMKEDWCVAWVRNLLELTVKLHVRSVSPARPASYPDSSGDPYPYHISGGGGRRPRSASGYVYNVAKCGEGGEVLRNKTCECEPCGNSLNPRATWWEVFIMTAAHVVYDQEECEDTNTRFFFDDKDSELVEVTGHKILYTDVLADVCSFSVCIHDEAVGERLMKAMRSEASLKQEHREELQNCPVVVVSSHPHGCSKHITIGHRVGEPGPFHEPVYYTADTCPGSSGGMVVVGGKVMFQVGVAWAWSVRKLHHSEGMQDGTNRSGINWMW